MDKRVSFEQIVRICREYRQEGKRIVFTNGCFDIIHAGHVTYLDKARKLGDVLILGLNSDRSVKQIKGEKRPVINQDHRAVVLSAFECIDHIVLFDEPDPGILIEAVIPDVLVKGADWSKDRIVGADFVKKQGGKIERVVLEPGLSTTGVIEKIGKLYYGK